ncbi:MAG: hypothetical protein PWR17_975 [Candidatus Methanomethylophilaceae archaeon]|nr:hypothetical protein [Candidatus Methanomethylophilaceae archaeon]
MVEGYRWVWLIINVVGIMTTVLGMLGVIGLMDFEGAPALFIAGTLLIMFSAIIVFYNAFKLGLLKEPETKDEAESPGEAEQKKGDD